MTTAETAAPSNPDQVPDQVTVTGVGAVAVAADRVRIALGVQVLRPDAGEAFATASRTVADLLAVLADNGVPARSVRTQDLTFGPQTQWEGSREVMLGYQASQRLVVTLDALATVERVLSQVVARSGPGIRVDEVSLISHDTDAASTAARERAMADARAHAEHWAALSGRSLGRVLRIDETAGALQPSGRAFAKRAAPAAADAGMPVAGGDTELSVTVTVRWQLV